MKSFGIKRDEKDPRWAKFIEWLNEQGERKFKGDGDFNYGITKRGACDYDEVYSFDRIITLDEWESEFMQPKLAGREYDEKLFSDWYESQINFETFLNQRYAKTDRIAELKQQIEKLSDELKELEG
jgi:hypothetical protein